jgi:hypothetical protein
MAGVCSTQGVSPPPPPFEAKVRPLEEDLFACSCLLVLFYFTQPTAHAGSSNAVAASPSEGAVRVLQAAVRGWLQRQAYLWELEFFKENEASVVVLQTAYRGMACGARTKKSTFVVSLTAMFVLLRFSSIKPRRAAPPTPLIFCSLQGEAGLPNATRIPQ